MLFVVVLVDQGFRCLFLGMVDERNLNSRLAHTNKTPPFKKSLRTYSILLTFAAWFRDPTARFEIKELHVFVPGA